MAFYDEERILEDADSLTVAEFLGLEVRRAGNRHQIYCPGHMERLGKPDTHMGSCYLTPKGYHCYACSKTVSLPNMVMEVENCDYKEALGIIADSIGGREHYVISGKKDYEEHEKILGEDDLTLIGLVPTISFDIPVNCAETKEEIIKFNQENMESEDENKRRMNVTPKTDPNDQSEYPMYLAVHHQTVSLKSIFQEDPVYYYFLVRNKASEAMEKYKNWAEQLDDPSSFQYNMIKLIYEPYDDFNANTLYEFKNIFLEKYNRAREIYLSITPAMAGEETPEEEPKPKKKEIRLDLFSDIS